MTFVLYFCYFKAQFKTLKLAVWNKKNTLH